MQFLHVSEREKEMSHRGEPGKKKKMKKIRFPWKKKPGNVISLKSRRNICFTCDMLISTGSATIGHPGKPHKDRRGRACECACVRY